MSSPATIFRRRDSQQTSLSSPRRSREFFACKESQFPAPFNHGASPIPLSPPLHQLPSSFPARRRLCFPHPSIRSSCILYSRALPAFPSCSSPSSSVSLATFPSILSRAPVPRFPPLVPIISFYRSAPFHLWSFLLRYHLGFTLPSFLHPRLLRLSLLSSSLSLSGLFKLSPLTHSNFLTFLFFVLLFLSFPLSFSLPLFLCRALFPVVRLSLLFARYSFANLFYFA